MLEQQLRESGGAAAHASSSGTAAGSGVGGDVPVPEAIAEDELVVIRHRLQGELNSIDGRYVRPVLQHLLHASDHSEFFPAFFPPCQPRGERTPPRRVDAEPKRI